MSSSNEITVKITQEKSKFIPFLKSKGFKEIDSFLLDDYYFIRDDIDLEKLTTREIVSKLVLVRDCKNRDVKNPQIIFKQKEINHLGEIQNQKEYTCNIYNLNEAIDFFKHIGYRQLVNIKECGTVFSDGEIQFAIKDVEGENLMIEIETGRNKKYNTIEKLKQALKDYEIPFDSRNYFVKKVEIAVNKVLNRKVAE